MERRHGLFSIALYFCAPILVLVSFAFLMSPLGLGFSGSATGRLQSPFALGAYWLIYIAGPLAVFVGLPFSVALSTKDHTRRRAFQLLVGGTALLVPAQLSFLFWLSS